MKRTAAVICNYNKADFVVNCIQSVIESKADDFDIFVVDNASTDDSVERVRKMYGDKVTLLVNEENLGGSGGFNTGIREAVKRGYEYVWCLDNDVLVDENALGELEDFMGRHLEVGMAGSKVVNMDDTDVVQQFGLTVDFENFCMEAKYLGCVTTSEMPDVVYSDAVAACSVLVRSSLIEKIGSMPEENFLYWDDTEWGIRCNLAGYRVASVGSSIVAHAMGAKKESVNTFATYYAWRNWIVFFLKYTKPSQLPRMCNTFLSSIFEIIYEGLYRDEENKMKTVMFAYDDALHCRMGKATDGKIFDIDRKDKHLKRLVVTNQTFCIESNGRGNVAASFAEHILEYKPDAEIYIDGELVTGKEKSANEKNTAFISLCENIFQQEDLTLNKIYVDDDENILLDDDDVLMVINYAYSRRTFIASQTPVFLNCAREIQEKVQGPGVT
ncbi:MAG: glycosyltransferase family 2 protein [Clostridiales bacterium]|nr:glycosyltransferase family 2 protein [Clostridiales bacterium]